MENRGSWILFLIGIGFLFIMFSPKINQPIIFIIGGLVIVLLGVIILKKFKNNERKNKK